MALFRRHGVEAAPVVLRPLTFDLRGIAFAHAVRLLGQRLSGCCRPSWYMRRIITDRPPCRYDKSLFAVIRSVVESINRKRVVENLACLIEADTMLGEVRSSFPIVPFNSLLAIRSTA